MKELNVITHFTTGAIEEITFKDDPTNFRWTRKYFGVVNGLNYLSEKKEEDNKTTLIYEYFNGLILTVIRELTDKGVTETYILSNPTEKAVEIADSYTISISFADDSDIASVALNRRAYARVYNCGNCLAVYNSRFDGQSDGVGLVLTNGEIGAVKQTKIPRKSTTVIEIGFTKGILEPKAESSFSWLIFGYASEKEFVSTVREYQPFPLFNKYPVMLGETVEIDTEDELYIDGIPIDTKSVNVDNANIREEPTDVLSFGTESANQDSNCHFDQKHDRGCVEKSQTEKKSINIDKDLIIKLKRGEKSFDFVLHGRTFEELGKSLFVESFYQKQSQIDMIERAKSNPLDAKSLLLDYFKKKNKKYFDVGMPYDVIKNDTELKTLFLEKAEYALTPEKGYYYPYQILAKYEYLTNANELSPDPRFSHKLAILEPLYNAIVRLCIIN